MKKIFILLGMLLLGIVSYSEEKDILGTWIIENSGKVVEIYKTEDGKYNGKLKENDFIFLKENGKITFKEKNYLGLFLLYFPNSKIDYVVTILIQEDGSLLLNGYGSPLPEKNIPTRTGEYEIELHLIKEK